MIRYKNEQFLEHHEINELLDETSLSTKEFCSSLMEHYYLDGSVHCLFECESDEVRTNRVLMNSIFKRSDQNTDYAKGIYDLNLKYGKLANHIKGFFINCSLGSIGSNRSIIAFQITDYCTIEAPGYSREASDFLILHDSDGFNETLQTEFKIANTDQKSSIHDKFDRFKIGALKENYIKELEKISLDKGLWYNNEHFNRCLVDELLSENNSKTGITKFYRFSDVETKMSEHGISVNFDSKYNKEKISDKFVNNQDDKTIFEKFIDWFSSTNHGKHKGIVLNILNKYKDEYPVDSIPSFNEIKSFIANNENILPYKIELGNDKKGKEIQKLIYLNEPAATFQQIQRTYNKQAKLFISKK
ncbi:hypothetical protein [Marinicella rhabdoformis]|uniref:hypothetical protein n=1 Tax=Marinicella rhabdoformis TaxID=2580566 RepID=UPI0012AED126|nr:hypothetical protein [Marinicella rhabdoformis]